MGRGIKIDYITNCAVLIQYGTVKILVDGIFSGRQPFDVMDPETERQIMEGKGMFKNINFILVTHCHNDHYNGRKILNFLQAHKEAVVVVPANAKLDCLPSEERIRRIYTDTDAVCRLKLDGFDLEYMKTGHLTFNYPEHYCLNVIFEEGNILLTADMNLDRLQNLKEFTQKEESWLFMNAIALWHKKWRQRVLDLNYSRICFYHVPSEGFDNFGYRKKALIHWQKHKDDCPNWILLG